MVNFWGSQRCMGTRYCEKQTAKGKSVGLGLEKCASGTVSGTPLSVTGVTDKRKKLEVDSVGLFVLLPQVILRPYSILQS